MSMKKTLMALGVIASITASASAMAWTSNGVGGNISVGGTLTPANNVTPWEVSTGAPVTNLDADIQQGDSYVDILVTQPIPVLGMRGATTTFKGGPDFSPSVDYRGAIDATTFKSGITTLTLDIKDNTTDSKIGTMSVDLLAGAGVSRIPASGAHEAFSAYTTQGSPFYGALGNSSTSVINNLDELITRIGALDGDIVANFTKQNASNITPLKSPSFDVADTSYSAFYGSGIEAGSRIKINLDSPAAGSSTIAWKAALPIVVSYN